MKFSTQIKPISYLKAHAAEVVRKLAEQRKPVVITQNGEAKAGHPGCSQLGGETSWARYLRCCS